VKTFQRDLSGYDTLYFLGMLDPLTLASTSSDYGEHYQMQTGSSNNLANGNRCVDTI